ncbi:polysaccharide deacetylase family protein [Hydrogenophaga sp.]|uniref:polysaccharide deacetylase family protein n=1 Tax=Hydrogenophaga sp. TaxID=1904254 RepID=UPI00273195FD|nr:polysaccharide deacetylase family protein [Hydrogenophaga sp.]MDP2073788.1 polysaccharide deacetylase family protein [Hydrogenophaga sp.]MDP3106912.1 polysaccharide deacetylase family protein [Hydrogenophaga sp.]MDZ4397932.1 polysaccharide deacetylase family protein [Hydrogenophaga sp.]
MIRRGVLEVLSKDKLSVFLFHKVPPNADPLIPGDITRAGFERILDQVVSQFRVLPLEDAVARLHSGRLPRRAACITFDDGYADWMHGAAPALLKRDLHATFFITTGQFGGQPLWHERIQAAVRALPGPLLDIGMPSLGQPSVATLADRQALVVRLEQDLKYLTLAAREQVLLRLEAAAGVQPESLPRMSAAQLRDLHSQGFGVGGHTINHPILDYCDEQELVKEVAGVREQLQGLVGGAIAGFAYPNGRPHADFSRHHVEAVRRAGYAYAVTTHWGVANSATSPFQIPRFTPWAQREWHALYQAGRNLLLNPVQVPETAG